MRTEQAGLLAAIPKAKGIAKRFMIALLAGFIFLCVLFIYFLHSSQPKQRIAKQEEVVVDEQASAQAIRALLKDDKHVAAQSENAQSVSSMTQPTIDPAILTSAADAPISAYHAGTESGLHSSGSSASSVAGGVPSAEGSNNPYQAQNQQSEKLSFIDNAGGNKEAYINSTAQLPVSPYEVKAGAIIPATLQTAINSDLPGTIVAKVRRDVFDTVSGNYLLIPQGTTLIGVYDSQVAYGQKRVLIAWERLIFPNGMSQNILGQPGVDLAGQSGLQDQVDNHYTRIFGSAVMFSMLGAAGQLSQPRIASDQISTQQILYSAIGQQLSQTGTQMAARNMNIQPTLEIREGADFNVLLTKDLVLPGPYKAHG